MAVARAVLSFVSVAVSQAQGLEPPPAQLSWPPAADVVQHSSPQLPQEVSLGTYRHGLAQFQQEQAGSGRELGDDQRRQEQVRMGFRQGGFSRFQQAPIFAQMDSGFRPLPGEDSGTCGLAADADSECCKTQREQNPLSQGASLAPHGVYCAQAADTRWWNVKVVRQNCDGSYAVVVQDDAQSEWPVTQRALMLDRSCEAFYKDALRDAGIEVAERQDAQEAQATPQGRIRTDASNKRVPWKIVAGAAAAATMPMLYHLSSTAGA